MIAKQKLIPTPRKSAWPKVRRMPSFPKAARSTMVRRTSWKKKKKENRLIFISCKMHYSTIESDAVRLLSSGRKKRKLVLAGGGQSIFFVQSYSIIECVCLLYIAHAMVGLIICSIYIHISMNVIGKITYKFLWPYLI